MKTLLLLFILSFIFTNFIPNTFALDARGHLRYSSYVYENDLEIFSPYQLKTNEAFLVACNKPGDNRLQTFSKITREHLTVFPALLWSSKFMCHISVIDTKRRGRIVLSSGSFQVKTPAYYLP